MSLDPEVLIELAALILAIGSFVGKVSSALKSLEARLARLEALWYTRQENQPKGEPNAEKAADSDRG